MLYTNILNLPIRWSFEPITSSKNLFNEINAIIPDIDVKTSYGSLDESIITEKDIDGNELKTTYILKASENGKKFEYKHLIQEETDIDKVRNIAFTQLDAWKFKIEQNKTNKE